MNPVLNSYGHVFVLARTYHDHGTAEVLGAFSSKEKAVERLISDTGAAEDYTYTIQVCFLDGKLGCTFDGDPIYEGALAARKALLS